MEPPAKRPRVEASWPDDGDDELAFDPFDLPEGEHITSEDEFERAAFDTRNRFQSAMASIFERYDRDFEGIGDEIDLMTENVVVDNGHLSGMRDEHDIGLADFADEEEGEEEEDEGGLRLCDLLDVSLLVGPERPHAEEELEEIPKSHSEKKNDTATVTNGTADSEEGPEATATSLEALTIAPSGDGRGTNGDISPERAAVNKARLQGRRSPTPTGFATSIWRLDTTPPKRSAQGNKLIPGTKERRGSEPSKAVTRPVASKISPPKKSSSTAPAPASEKRPPGRPRKTLAAASGNVRTLETRSAVNAGLQENVDGTRRSSRPSVPVDYLGKVAWTEFEDQKRPAEETTSSSVEQSPEPDSEQQEAPLNNTSTVALTNSHERVIANSQETHIPSSSEISSSTRPSELTQSSAIQPSQLGQSQPSQTAGTVQTKHDAPKEQTWENIFDLSDDEMPMPLPVPRATTRMPTAVGPRSTIVVELVSRKGTEAEREEWVDLYQSTTAEDDTPSTAATTPDQDQETVLGRESRPESAIRVEEEAGDDEEADDDDEPLGHVGNPEATAEGHGQGDTHMIRSPEATTEGHGQGDLYLTATGVPETGDISMDDPFPDSDDAPAQAQLQNLAQPPQDPATSPDRATSLDLGTSSHDQPLRAEIPESPDYTSAVFPSSSPIKLSSPTKRPLPVEESDLPPPQPSHQSPQPQPLMPLNNQRSSPSTNRAVRLQNHRYAQSPSKLNKPPIRTYAPSPTSRSIWDPRPSPPPRAATSTSTSPKKSSPLKKATSKPATPKTPSYRTTRKIATPSSRHSLLSFTKDRDDVDELSEVIVEEAPLRRRGTISGRMSSHGTSTPRSTGRKKARLPYRPRMSTGAKGASDMAEVVQSPGGTTRVCGVNGFRCDRDFCFSCL